MVRTIRVALFICGELTPKLMANHGDMLTIYQQWLRNSLPRYSGVRLVMDGYDAPGMIYPNELQLSRYDAVMLTGSRVSSPLRMRLVQMLVGCLASDAGGDEPWIKRLVTFVQHVGDEHPQIKIYGTYPQGTWDHYSLFVVHFEAFALVTKLSIVPSVASYSEMPMAGS